VLRDAAAAEATAEAFAPRDYVPGGNGALLLAAAA
jgi:hypothetical protein